MSSESHLSLEPRRGRPRRLRRDQTGAAAVEFVLVAIPLFFILYGLIAFGMMLALKQSVTNAAAEGARAVVGVIDELARVAVHEPGAAEAVADTAVAFCLQGLLGPRQAAP